ncbi:hypothetical protein C1G86_1605 [Dehalococcoides mccartyi]|uniref:Uncharacterized protein n=1 Tax=Dehalococcoides mccartyi TaxID=61435 RepID=A0A328EN72_9CHLR|nr:hypothetical protein [Dehalococcoides mccartyi]AGG05900.1 hypothetical protein dcmb_269 [Dehalococcoides mccartyi DCMB5]RAL70074.1 hypothetical protein C1G86_1605 [Dehalococcoides mccartyi]
MKSFSDLRYFCEYIVNKYGSPSNASEEDKAQEFRKIYLRELPLDLRTLRAIASACGIHVNGVDSKKLPQNIRGYHDVFDDNRNIYYKNGDTISGIENTILHEFREMIEPVFGELYLDYSPLRTSAVHLVANKFATAVLLPKDEFREKVYETGFDVIALSKLYSKSCSQVLIRMGEVLQGNIFLYSALYEPGPEVGSWILNYWTGSTNNDDPDANICGADGLFPRKGRAVLPGSLVDMVIKAKKPHLARRITILDSKEDDGLVAVARPLVIGGALAKVVLVVVLSHSIGLLQPQIERTKPVEVEEFHKHL